MTKQYSMEDFKEIIKMLRSENGCPWDKEQTHESLKPCIMEEAAELVSSIRIYDQTGNADNMKEELGDILLQVVMHSQMGMEEGLFTFEDVIQEISEKMIRRHPHVFGEVIADGSDQVLKNWDEIKKKEKEGKTWIASPLQEIPKELPALTRAPKVLKKIDKLYKPAKTMSNTISDLEGSINKLKSLQGQETISEQDLKPLLGEMLLDISNIAREHRIATEQVLTDKIEDLIEFFEANK